MIRNAGRWLKRASLRALRACATDKARYNTLLNQHEIWHERTRLDSSPRWIQVGTNWTCNLRCCFCRRQNPSTDLAGAASPRNAQTNTQTGTSAGDPENSRVIPRPVMERLLEILPFAEVFSLTPLGEPLMYPDLEWFLERYQAVRARNLQMTTNGVLINEQWARRLVEAGTRRLFVSMESADPNLYSQMRVGARLEQVSRGLDLMNEWKDRLGAQSPEIIMAATFLRRNIEGLPELVRYARDHRMARVSVQLMEAEVPGLEPETLEHHLPVTMRALKEARRLAAELGVTLEIHEALQRLLAAHRETPEVAAWLDEAAQTKDAAGHADRARTAAEAWRPRSVIERCIQPWASLMVDTDGDCRPCCWAGISIGNLAVQPFDAVWNSRAAQSLRRAFLADIIPAGCRDKHCRIELEETGSHGQEKKQ
ncbi:MAG: radical SAM protein [Candidatus Sumerlaeota bacterium]|nr:radical SAM protein [Candidatus Sumerlaeota bacterium]